MAPADPALSTPSQWTTRAAELAREGRTDPTTGVWRPLGLYESLRAARVVMDDEQRRPAVARAVEQVVRCDQRDPRMAEVAVHTMDLDRLAAELAGRVDYAAWADRLAPAITTPAPVTAPVGPLAAAGRTVLDEDGLPEPTPVPAEPAARPVDADDDASGIPSQTAEAVVYWLRRDPTLQPADIAAKLGRSRRTVRRYWPHDLDQDAAQRRNGHRPTAPSDRGPGMA